MKKLISIIIDLLFLTSLFVGVLLAGVIIIYFQTHDLTVLNDILRSDVYRAILAIYAVFMLIVALYLVIIPTFLKSTIGEYLMGFIYTPLEKVNMLTVFLRTTIGALWQIITFPYNVFAAFTKRRSFSNWFSGITIEPKPGRFKASRFGMILSLFFAVLLIGLIAYGAYVYQFGPIKYIEQYMDHEKQVKFYISQHAYSAAKVSAEKYKIYNGETPSYWYYSCVVESKQNTYETTLETCNKALEINTDETRKLELLEVKASLLKDNQKPTEALAIYEDLWNNYQIRSFEMANYVYLLQNKGDEAKAVEVLNELYKALDTDQHMDSIQRGFFASYYYNLNKFQEALDIYTFLIAHQQEDGISVTQLGDLYYNQALCYYQLGKYTEAKETFQKAKESNPDYTDSADTYIIDIEFRAKKK